MPEIFFFFAWIVSKLNLLCCFKAILKDLHKKCFKTSVIPYDNANFLKGVPFPFCINVSKRKGAFDREDSFVIPVNIYPINWTSLYLYNPGYSLPVSFKNNSWPVLGIQVHLGEVRTQLPITSLCHATPCWYKSHIVTTIKRLCLFLACLIL